jgi:hypothetical protein
MEAAVELVLDLVLYLFVGAFLLGLCLNLVTGSGRALKYCLSAFAVLFGIAAVAGLVLSGGLLIFLLFQLIILMLLFLFTIFVGGLCGSGVLRLVQDYAARKTVAPQDLTEHLPLAEFAEREGIDVERVLARIRSGYYKGGRFAGAWYVHRAELSRSDNYKSDN